MEWAVAAIAGAIIILLWLNSRDWKRRAENYKRDAEYWNQAYWKVADRNLQLMVDKSIDSLEGPIDELEGTIDEV